MPKLTLNDICQYRNENMLSTDLSDNVYISTETMQPNREGISSSDIVTPTTKKVKAFYPGDILVSNIRPYFKKIWRATFAGGCSNDVLVFSPKCNSEYLYWLLSTDSFFNYMMATSKGTKMPRGDKKAIMKYIVPDHSDKEQRQIASFLNPLQNKIALNNRINDYLDQLIDCKFNSLLCEFENHKVTGLDWRIGTISEFVNEIISGDWGKDSSQANFTRQVRCVRGADIPMVFKGDKSKAPVRYILEKNFFKKRLFENDVIIEISGGSPSQSTGRSVYICSSLINRYEEPLVCTNFCRALRLNEDYSFYISCYFRYLYKRGVFFSYENGTTGIKNLDLNAVLNNENIVIPSKSVIDDFNKMYKKIVSMKYALGKENDRLSILRDALLPKLMSGEIDVSKIDLSS